MKSIVAKISLVALAGAAVLGLTGVKAAENTADKLLAQFREEHPDLPVVGVSETPAPGIYAVELQGSRFIYTSADGRYLLTGELLTFEDGEVVSLTQQAQQQRSRELQPVRKRLIDAIPDDQVVVFAPQGDTKASITVFTDVECGWCQRLHQHIDELNEMGIAVRYLAYPAQGPSAYSKIAGAWCADDRKATLDRLLSTPRDEQSAPPADCDHPVDEHFELGRRLGVQGTPGIVLEDGRMVGGYVPPQELAATLGI